MRKMWVVFLLLLSGCFLGYDRPSAFFIDFSSVFHEKVYLVNEFSYNREGGIGENLEIKYGDISTILVPSGKRMSEDRIYFYQDAAHECYLFSIASKDMRDLTNAFYDLDIKQNGFKLVLATLLVEKDHIRVVSRKEYNNLKPTLQPHPFDPSLCKPKPSEHE